jgi:S-adenosylmethionine:tRNA ribosyltransferase-isomerase
MAVGQPVTAFDYDLPDDAVAQHPVEPRDSARLLDATGDRVRHRRVHELEELLGPGDVMVVNDTKVLRARLELFKPTGGAVEVLVLEPTGRPNEWQALVRPGRRVAPGTDLYATAGGGPVAGNGAGGRNRPMATVGAVLSDGRRLVTMAPDAMERAGQVPLPPYITEPLDDPDRYQTVYARRPGSVAAPTAGLHLTEELIDRIRGRGVEIVTVELVVGLGTFRPITTEDVAEHEMHRERYRIDPEAWERITGADRVLAIGTTVVRALESAAVTGQLEASTELFIRRGFQWRVVDLLLTNFHVPRSSLLVMIDAFAGERWRSLYREALEHNYRFLSFGDCMLLARAVPGESPSLPAHDPGGRMGRG